MTGYGKSEALLENGKLTVEFRSVNGKNADINIKTSLLPKDKEMGVRKCYGAGAGNIYWMLIRETALNLLASLAVAALVIWAFDGVIESLLGVPVGSLMVPQTRRVLVTIIVLIFLVSALIPAMMFVRIPVSTAFSGYRENKRRWKLTLLMVQVSFVMPQ